MIEVPIWETEYQEMVVIHRLNNIIRYNTRNKINQESVAAHSFFTTYFVTSICKQYAISDEVKLLALEAAVMHDVPEVYINDITYDCKQLITGLEEMLEQYEHNIINQVSETAAAVLFDPQTKAEKLALAIVELADVLSVKQYVMSEIELGNSSFNEIMTGTNHRIFVARKAMAEALKQYKEEQKDAQE